jgi:DNA-3-methyladenine glycosylase II
VNEPGAPFRLDLTAWALRRRTHNTIDRFDAGTYRRALPLGRGAAALSVTQRGSRDAPRLTVALAGAYTDERAAAAARVALDRLLGLSVDLSGFAAMAAADPLIDRLAARMRGLKPPRFPTVFEALVNAVACQQLSLTVGIHLLNRLTAAHGRPVADEPDALRTLTRVRGLGRWSAEYVLLRGLGRLHVFPGDDVGAHNKLKRLLDIEGRLDYQRVERLVARWRPYAGVVYFHLLLDSLSEGGLVALNAEPMRQVHSPSTRAS